MSLQQLMLDTRTYVSSEAACSSLGAILFSISQILLPNAASISQTCFQNSSHTSSTPDPYSANPPSSSSPSPLYSMGIPQHPLGMAWRSCCSVFHASCTRYVGRCSEHGCAGATSRDGCGRLLSHLCSNLSRAEVRPRRVLAPSRRPSLSLPLASVPSQRTFRSGVVALSRRGSSAPVFPAVWMKGM